jgi:hypothetical protein
MISQLNKKLKMENNSGVLLKIKESLSVLLKEKLWLILDSFFKKKVNGTPQKKEFLLLKIHGRLLRNL